MAMPIISTPPSPAQRHAPARPAAPIAHISSPGTATGVIVRVMKTGATVTDRRSDSAIGTTAMTKSIATSLPPPGVRRQANIPDIASASAASAGSPVTANSIWMWPNTSAARRCTQVEAAHVGAWPSRMRRPGR